MVVLHRYNKIYQYHIITLIERVEKKKVICLSMENFLTTISFRQKK